MNNPTDKRIVLFERVNKSNNNWKVFTWGENSTTQKKREILRSKINPEKENLISQQTFNKQNMVKFLVCYNTTPVNKNLVLEIC